MLKQGMYVSSTVLLLTQGTLASRGLPIRRLAGLGAGQNPGCRDDTLSSMRLNGGLTSRHGQELDVCGRYRRARGWQARPHVALWPQTELLTAVCVVSYNGSSQVFRKII